MARCVVVLNARSGPHADTGLPDRVRAMLAEAGVQGDVVAVDSGKDILAAVDRALEQGAEVIAAGGGDGTQSAVASRLAGTDTVQGVLPCGTLNHFAKDLGIPLDLREAVGTLASGRVVQVDVGEVNGHVFINNSSIGLYADVVRERELQQARLGKGKWRALASAMLHATRGRPAVAVRVETEGDQHVRRTPFVFIGNNRYTLEGLRMGAREALQDGELALSMGRRTGRLGLLWLALRALVGKLDGANDFETVSGRSFTIQSRKPRMRVAADGEVLMLDTPLQYRIRPRALKVLVPAQQS